MLATYRSDELHRRHPLRPVLAELERAPRVERIALERFTRAEVTEQLTGILDDEPDPDLADRLYARSQGNALYTEELLAASSDGCGRAARPRCATRCSAASSGCRQRRRTSSASPPSPNARSAMTCWRRS